MLRASVTGTNGKTSTVWMLASIFEAAGLPTADLTGLGPRWRGQPWEIEHGISLREFAERIEDRGGEALVQEVTSRALAGGWADELPSDIAVYTNLAADHHEWHGSADAYAEAKAKLFRSLRSGATAILPRNDLRMDALGGTLALGVDVRRFASAERTEVDVEGTTVLLGDDTLGSRQLRIPHVGAMFADNAVAAATAAVAAGIELSAIEQGLASASVPPGRFEVIATEPTIVVDFAHNEDALRRALQTARGLAGDGRVLVVFGAGGDRMPDKRRPMGKAAAELADDAWITNDNPRTEDPSAIADEIGAGYAEVRGELPVFELHRPTAIARALEHMDPDDVLVVAGQGADAYHPTPDEPSTTDTDVILELCR